MAGVSVSLGWVTVTKETAAEKNAPAPKPKRTARCIESIPGGDDEDRRPQRGKYDIYIYIYIYVLFSHTHIHREREILYIYIYIYIYVSSICEIFLEFSDEERGIEALVSVLVSAYALPFSVRTPTQMVLGCLSIAFSTYNVAMLIHQHLDLEGLAAEEIRGNHLSNTTCLTHVFFKSGESCCKLDRPYSTSNALENKRGRIGQVALVIYIYI